jgi:hypothetical protein
VQVTAGLILTGFLTGSPKIQPNVHSGSNEITSWSARQSHVQPVMDDLVVPA